jgi:hypothetical protein
MYSVRSRNSGSDLKNMIGRWDWVAFKHNTGFLIGGERPDGEGVVVHTWDDGLRELALVM